MVHLLTPEELTQLDIEEILYRGRGEWERDSCW